MRPEEQKTGFGFGDVNAVVSVDLYGGKQGRDCVQRFGTENAS